MLSSNSEDLDESTNTAMENNNEVIDMDGRWVADPDGKKTTLENSKKISIWGDDIGKEDYMPTHEVNQDSVFVIVECQFFLNYPQSFHFFNLFFFHFHSEYFKVQVPIILTLCTMAAYIVLGALVFANLEDWTLTDSIYFSFITLTTVGFGDFVPHPRYTHILQHCTRWYIQN